MLRLERDPAFWRAVLAHQDVRGPTLHGHPFEDILPLLERPHLPLAATHGGYLMRNLDGLGIVWELHAAFTPEGWGKEALEAGWSLYERIFGPGAQMITLTEQRACWRSRPPLSHGWRNAGEFFSSSFGELRLWFLSREAWTASVAYRRRSICLQS